MLKRSNRIELLVVIIFLGGLCNPANSLTRDELFPFGTEHQDEHLEVGDDLSSPRIDLKSPFTFYGNQIAYLYVRSLIS